MGIVEAGGSFMKVSENVAIDEQFAIRRYQKTQR